jgi:hypothetical protein
MKTIAAAVIWIVTWVLATIGIRVIMLAFGYEHDNSQVPLEVPMIIADLAVVLWLLRRRRAPLIRRRAPTNKAANGIAGTGLIGEHPRAPVLTERGVGGA